MATQLAATDIPKAILDSMNYPIFSMDEELRYVYWNKGSEELTGIKAKDAIGKSLYELFPAIKGTEVDKSYQKVIKTKEPIAIRNSFELNDTLMWFDLEINAFDGGITVLTKDVTVEVELAEELDKERNFIERVTDTSPSGIYIYSFTEGKNLYINEQYTNILGYTLDEINNIPADDFSKLFHPDDVDKVFVHMGEVQEGNKNVKIDYRFKHKNGHWVWCRSFDTPFDYDEKGNVSSFLGAFIDVTEEKTTEQNFLQSEEIRSSLFNNNPLIMTLVDENHLIYDINYTIPGLEKSDVLGQSVFVFTEKEFYDELEQALDHVFKTGKSRSFISRAGHPDSEKTLWFENILGPVYEDGKVALVCINAVDITDKKNAQEEILVHKNKLDAIFNNTFNFTAFLEPDGTVIEVNDSALEFGGFERKDVIGLKFYDAPWWSLSKEINNQLKKAIKDCAKGEFVRYEVDVLGEGGKVITIDFSLSPIHDDNGKVIYLIPEGRDISDKIELQRALVEKNKLIEETQAIAGIGFWKVDVATGQVYWDDMVYSIAEVEPGTEINLVDGINFYHPDHREMVAEYVNNGIVNNEPWSFEALYVTAKKNEKWVKAVGYPVTKEGEVVELRGMFMDIDEQKQLEREQVLAKEQFEYVFNNVADLICLHNPDGTYLNVSPSSLQMTGYSPEEMVGKNPYSFFHPEDRERILNEAHQPIIDGKTGVSAIEYRFKHKKGYYLWFLTNTEAILDKENNIIQLVTSTKDVTRKNLDEAEIRRLNETLESRVAELTKELGELGYELQQQLEAMNVAAAIVSVTDIDGNITHVNEKFIEISGFNKEELIGQNHRILKSGVQPDGLFKGMWKAISMGMVWNGEICNKRKDGSRYWVKTTIYPFKNADGEIEKFVSVRFDITKIKEQEEALKVQTNELTEYNDKLSVLNKELETFSYSVSHDLKAPLRALQGFSKNLMTKYHDQLDETGQRWLDFIKDNAERMDVLIGDILAYSRIGRKELEKVDVHTEELVKQAFQQQSSIYSNKIKFDFDDLPVVKGDRVILGVVWQNLIGNALKYSSQNEVIQININHVEKDGFHHFKVSDNGIGFDMKFYDKLFGVFQRLHDNTEYEGTGVGLANVKRGVDKHGGQVSAKGEVGKGASFTFSIPVN